jgi:hypothetical protein
MIDCPPIAGSVRKKERGWAERTDNGRQVSLLAGLVTGVVHP